MHPAGELGHCAASGAGKTRHRRIGQMKRIDPIFSVGMMLYVTHVYAWWKRLKATSMMETIDVTGLQVNGIRDSRIETLLEIKCAKFQFATR
jgi:hypothetical protein